MTGQPERTESVSRVTVCTPGARVVFDEPRTGWHGVSQGMFLNVRGELDHDLIDVEFDREPGTIFHCHRDLLAVERGREETTP